MRYVSYAALMLSPALAAAAAVGPAAPHAPSVAPAHSACCLDPRLRDVLYSADEIYRLPAYVGYQIDLQFQSDEHFIGLGAGDLQGLAFSAAANHLFLKPKAGNVRTNLTVLTNRRIYHFDYTTVTHAPDATHADVLYALRFLYPADPPRSDSPPGAARAALPDERLPSPVPDIAAVPQQRNSDYRYAGHAELKPLRIWDDGVQTHLQFGPRAELPAVFVRNDDGSEALVDLHVEGDQIVVHRIARRFVLRRGRLSGSVVNLAFAGGGVSLPSGTLLPGTQRRLRNVVPPSR